MITFLTSVEIYVHGANDAYEVTDSGSYKGGTIAWDQIQNKMDVRVPLTGDDEGKILYIPYHAIMTAIAERASDTVEDPEDEFCVGETGETGTTGETGET